MPRVRRPGTSGKDRGVELEMPGSAELAPADGSAAILSLLEQVDRLHQPRRRRSIRR